MTFDMILRKNIIEYKRIPPPEHYLKLAKSLGMNFYEYRKSFLGVLLYAWRRYGIISSTDYYEYKSRLDALKCLSWVLE